MDYDLSTFEGSLPPAELSNVRQFMAVIEEARSSAKPDVWRLICAKSRKLRAWRHLLAEDPYTRHGYFKPRGYPGDATLMDYAYGHSSIQIQLQNATASGREIYGLTSAAAQSQSARKRVDLVAGHIRKAVAERGKIAVASFAAGHAREIEQVADISAQIDKFIAVDADSTSLAEVTRCYGLAVSVTGVNGNVLRLKPQKVGPADLVYSMGLFDYLDQPTAERVLSIMAAVVQPGGRLLIGNLSESAGNLGYCEAVMDWWMISRSEQDMYRLAGVLEGWTATVAQQGCFNYLLAEKP